MFAAFRTINATRARVLIQHDYLSPYSTPQCDGTRRGQRQATRPASSPPAKMIHIIYTAITHTCQRATHTHIYICMLLSHMVTPTARTPKTYRPRPNSIVSFLAQVSKSAVARANRRGKPWLRAAQGTGLATGEPKIGLPACSARMRRYRATR